MQRIDDLDGMAQVLLDWSDRAVIVLWRNDGPERRLLWKKADEDPERLSRELDALAAELRGRGSRNEG